MIDVQKEKSQEPCYSAQYILEVNYQSHGNLAPAEDYGEKEREPQVGE